ncbi:uncharacterized protein CANTADRAFT_143455 [Suhomyces tanzawaensis NRRL Y-17324]|uniref:Uncharacterized protein n=1 Tax=Suhomyces tanzawaensis NRRL Y-17324 TaxID=984487 RepID=A0A1E4SSB1_9ASCO|nr:uncharacterized protein CANTADRAFT_143455 [Suhomyces tanzawaensis NRRL Y-17324]ODV82385.1 hypothetical protein CANTADRAFT_143455 [Suhomyces tanzawaensis NRRL Y-17324]
MRSRKYLPMVLIPNSFHSLRSVFSFSIPQHDWVYGIFITTIAIFGEPPYNWTLPIKLLIYGFHRGPSVVFYLLLGLFQLYWDCRNISLIRKANSIYKVP